MPTKLKNLKVTSVDFVDQGANPDAHVQLFKRRTQEPDPAPKEGQKASETGVQKGAKMFTEALDRRILGWVTDEIVDFCVALSDSLSSIICDHDLTPDSKKAMLEQSMKEFTERVNTCAEAWAEGKTKNTAEANAATAAGIQKSAAQQQILKQILDKRGLAQEKEEYDTMNIDKSRMTPEDLAVLESFEKKYAIQEPEPSKEGVAKGQNPEPQKAEPTQAAADTGVAKGQAQGEDAQTEAVPHLHPDVAKALSDMQKAYAQQTEQVEALKKSLEIAQLIGIAKKYEPLGKNSEELATKMYELKKVGGTVYDDYVALLDENLAMIGKSQLFGEIGSNRQGSAGTADSISIKAAEIQKAASGGMTQADALVKAWEENPDLAAQYEREYLRR